MRRTESRKSHSWWWDSHISKKNTKWLSENLEEMDQSVKRMLKLIEEDGDSFAKKAEMYYQKRPELISYVEDFYRMYRSLAERYDHVTGELRKNIPSDLQSQCSGMSDFGSEPPSPDRRLSRRKSGPRAAGFEFFLGSGGSSSDMYQKEGDESSSLTDSEPESDDSSVNNYSGSIGHGGVDQGLRRKMIDLEIELREVKEKLHLQQEENDASLRGAHENSEDLLKRVAGYEHELRIANEKIWLSSEEISRLKLELQKYGSSEFHNLNVKLDSEQKDVKRQESELEANIHPMSEIEERINGVEAEISDSDWKIRVLENELRITKERLQNSEKELANLRYELESNRSPEKLRRLQDQLELAQKDLAISKAKLTTEKKEVSKLHERAARLKTSLSDRDHEIRDLKMAVSDAEQKIFPEKAQIKAEMYRLLEEETRTKEELRGLESRVRSLEEELRKVKAEKTEMEENHKEEIAEKDDCIENLNKRLSTMKSERDELNTKAITLEEEVSSRKTQIDQMDKHLDQLHMEHVELIAGKEEAHKMVKNLVSQVKELEEEVERHRVMIKDGAEEKREAIRQLCFSLDHYKNGYHRLRQAFVTHKRVAVLSS